MSSSSRVARYRLHTQPKSENVAQEHSRPTYEQTRLEQRPSVLLPSDKNGMTRVMNYIFNNDQWYRGFEEMLNTCVTMWSNRFDELIERVDDLHGLYKNRPVSEAINIMILLRQNDQYVFGLTPLTEFVSNIGIEYIIVPNPGYGIAWMIYLPQITVTLFALDVRIPGCITLDQYGEQIIVHSNVATKVTSMSGEHSTGKRQLVRVAGVFYPYTLETAVRMTPMSDIAVLGIHAMGLNMQTLTPTRYL
jgi:energy-converting hydrogenase A subunit M